MKKIIVFLGLLVASNLYSQTNDDWIFMLEYKEGSKYSLYYDLKTLEYKDDYILVWIKEIPLEPRYMTEDFNSVNKKEVEYILKRQKYFCGKRMIGWVNSYIYFKDGTNRPGEPANYTTFDRRIEVVPNTRGEEEYLFFCFK